MGRCTSLIGLKGRGGPLLCGVLELHLTGHVVHASVSQLELNHAKNIALLWPLSGTCKRRRAFKEKQSTSFVSNISKTALVDEIYFLSTIYQ